MLEYLTFYEALVAFFMGLGAFCLFLWGVASGALEDVEAIKQQVLELEGGGDDRPRA